MSSHKTVNLMDIEDAVAGRVEGLDGRFARKHLDSRDLGVGLFRYAARVRSPIAHSHGEQEEVYVVLAGSGRILLDGEVQDVRRWDVIRGAPEVIRAFEAGEEGLEILAVGGPRPADGDGRPVEAAWPEES